MSDGSFDKNVKSCFVLLHALNDLFIIRKGNAMLAIKSYNEATLLIPEASFTVGKCNVYTAIFGLNLHGNHITATR